MLNKASKAVAAVGVVAFVLSLTSETGWLALAMSGIFLELGAIYLQVTAMTSKKNV